MTDRGMVGLAICVAVAIACYVTQSSGPLWGLLALGMVF